MLALWRPHWAATTARQHPLLAMGQAPCQYAGAIHLHCFTITGRFPSGEKMTPKWLSLMLTGMMCCVLGCTDDNEKNLSADLTAAGSWKIGMWPNSLYKDGSDVYVADSGNNEIDIYHIESGQYEDSKIKLPVDSNPLQVSTDDSNVYIVASKSNLIYQYNKASGELTALNITGLNMPYSILTSGGCHVIVNSEYDYDNGTAAGSIAKICGSDDTRLPTTCKNPVDIKSLDNGYLLSCSGVYQYDSNYAITRTQGSALQKLDSNFDVVKSIFADDDPGTAAISKDYIVTGSSFKGVAHLLDHDLNVLDTYTIGDGSASMLVARYLYDDNFVIADFNHDKLFFVKVGSGKFVVQFEAAISDSEVARKGPLDIIYDNHSILVLNSLSETLDIYRINRE